MATPSSVNESPAQGGREPSLIDSLIPIVALVAMLIGAFLLFGDGAIHGPTQIALLLSGLIAAAVAVKNRVPWDSLNTAAMESVSSGLGAVFILLAVGALIGTWAMSGTIVAMVYYGLKILSPDYFYASACLLCAIVAVSIGTSWTVAGTLGIGLMGIAANMGLSPAIAAGAVISGAYFGDKASPLSDTVNLVAAATGAQLFKHLKETLWTSVPTLLVSLGLFAMLGSRGDFDATYTIKGLQEHFNISLWAFLPLLFVLVLAFLKVPPFVTIFGGALAGGLLAVILNSQAVIALAGDGTLPTPIALLKGVWIALANGFRIDTGEPAIDTLLSRGGMASMLYTVWIIMTALYFGAMVERGGFLAHLVDPIVRGARGTGALIAATVASCVGCNVIAADQYIAVVLPARMFKAEFARRGYDPVVQSRAIGDTATPTSALVPWNSCGAFMAATLGVSTFSYAPFTFFCLLVPVATMLLGFLGFRMVRLPGTAPAQVAEPKSVTQ